MVWSIILTSFAAIVLIMGVGRLLYAIFAQSDEKEIDL